MICWKIKYDDILVFENKEQEIAIKDGMLELEFGAFQIQTIRLSIEEDAYIL